MFLFEIDMCQAWAICPMVLYWLTCKLSRVACDWCLLIVDMYKEWYDVCLPGHYFLVVRYTRPHTWLSHLSLFTSECLVT